MTVSTHVVLEMHESCRCASCDRLLGIGDSVSECDGRAFCGQMCLSEHIGRMMARLHGPAARYDVDENGFDPDMMNKPRN